MEIATNPDFWWIKKDKEAALDKNPSDPTSSLAEFLEKEKHALLHENSDVGEILDEISRLSAQSPLGAYELPDEQRSIVDIMAETQKVYMETSKSFDQLSSVLSQENHVVKGEEGDEEEVNAVVYSDSFSTASPTEKSVNVDLGGAGDNNAQNPIINQLQDDNKRLLEDNKRLQMQLTKTNKTQQFVEELKDCKEINTVLQLQLDTLTKNHYVLKQNFDENQMRNTQLERRHLEFDSQLAKYKNELSSVQNQYEKSFDTITQLNRQLDLERDQMKSHKTQTDSDRITIMDLNRQIKEMERILQQRKRPDTVSSLILDDPQSKGFDSAQHRVRLEDRIQHLEGQLKTRDSHSTKIFLEVQEKFTEMKLKYESHIEDLEQHVNDLKMQNMVQQNKKPHCKKEHFEMYTQTVSNVIPTHDSKTVSTQTIPIRYMNKTRETTTLKCLQDDLDSKLKLIEKLTRTNQDLQRDCDDLKLCKNQRSTTMALDLAELKQVRCEMEKLRQNLLVLEDDYEVLKTRRLHDLNVLQQSHEEELNKCLGEYTPLREQIELQQVTIISLQQQLGSAKEDLAIISVERDYLNNLKQQQCIESDATNRVQELQKKISVLEKRYEDRELRLKGIVQGLAQKTVPNKQCEQCTKRQRQLIGYKLELDQLLASVRALKH